MTVSDASQFDSLDACSPGPWPIYELDRDGAKTEACEEERQGPEVDRVVGTVIEAEGHTEEYGYVDHVVADDIEVVAEVALLELEPRKLAVDPVEDGRCKEKQPACNL